MPDLPQELLDEIVAHLPSDDVKTLRACSLVAKSWVYPAQRLLFFFVELHARDHHEEVGNTHQWWKERISPANTELLGHVRSLAYMTDSQPMLWDPNALIDYLPSFRQLQSLSLCSLRMDFDFSQKVETFPFQCTLSSLHLSQVSLPWIAFATLVGSFPFLRNLNIHNPSYDKDDQRPTALSRPLRGRLVVDISIRDALVVLSDGLSRMRVEYKELTLHPNIYPLSRQSRQRIVNTCRKSLQLLNLLPRACILDLSCCPELQRVHLFIISPDDGECTTISSITSTNIRAIVVTPFLSHVDFRKLLETPRPFISLLDRVLSELVDRLRASGYNRVLVLEFRLVDMSADYTVDLNKCFPKFRKKGRVILTHYSTEETMELSVRHPFVLMPSFWV